MANPTETITPLRVRYSEEFNDEQAEVTYQSSDGVLFRIHAIYLKAHTEGLAPPEGSSLADVVELTEPSSILKLLFKFFYPTRPPVLDLEVEFDVVKNLAEAAEKYQVFPAMYACYLQMHVTLPNHAVSVLGYSLKHDYTELVDEAAPHVIDTPLPDIIDTIPSEFYGPWLTYYSKWLDVQKRALSIHLPSSIPSIPTISQLASKLASLRDYQQTFSGQADHWKSPVEADIKAIPKMSELIGTRELSQGTSDSGQDDSGAGNVALEGSDGPKHHVHLAVLQACSTGFDDPLGNTINIPEKSSTIRLLLRFIKPVRSPDLRTLAFDELKDLAYAAEKYAIRQATGICRTFMKKALPENGSDIFHYAARFRYLDVLDLAAPLMLGSIHMFEETIERLPLTLVPSWARYYQSWQDAAKSTLNEAIVQESKVWQSSGGYVEYSRGYNRFGDYAKYDEEKYEEEYNQPGYCNCQGVFYHTHIRAVVTKLLESPAVLRNLDEIFPLSSRCSQAQTAFWECRKKAESLTKAIPSLSSYT